MAGSMNGSALIAIQSLMRYVPIVFYYPTWGGYRGLFTLVS